MTLSIEFIFSYENFYRASDIWDITCFSDYISKCNFDVLTDGFTGVIIEINKIKEYLDRASKQISFDIEIGLDEPNMRPSIRFFHLVDRAFARLVVSDLDCLISLRDKWLKNIIEHENFVHARIYNTRFDFLQNMTSIQSFEIEGIDHSQLPKKHNGLPTPLAEMTIDTSDNPGRWQFQSGYIEAVGAEMWLGKRFFELVNLPISTLKNAEWLDVDELENVVHLTAYDKPFDSAQGEQGEIQNRLHDLLFSQAKKIKILT